MGLKKPRVTNGQYKGKNIEIPSYNVRPITERTKRSLFDTLNPVIKDSKCLDLFCGSGTIGIEALSRGALHVTFVDVSLNSIKLLKQNLFNIGIDKNKYSVYKHRFNSFLEKFKDIYFDIIFVDPPFPLFDTINFSVLSKAMNPDTVLMIKIPGTKYKSTLNTLNNLFEIVHQKKIGINNLIYMKIKSN